MSWATSRETTNVAGHRWFKRKKPGVESEERYILPLAQRKNLHPLIHSIPPKNSAHDLVYCQCIERSPHWQFSVRPVRASLVEGQLDEVMKSDICGPGPLDFPPRLGKRGQAGKHRLSCWLIVKHSQEAVVLCNIDNNTI